MSRTCCRIDHKLCFDLLKFVSHNCSKAKRHWCLYTKHRIHPSLDEVGLWATAARHQGAVEKCWLPLIAGIVTEAYPARHFHVGHLNATSLFQYNTSGGKLNNSNVPKVQNVIQRMFNFTVKLKTWTSKPVANRLLTQRTKRVKIS